MTNINSHAHKRMQQRSIPTLVLDLLERCGTCVRCNGADRIIFDKRAQKRLKRYLTDHKAFAAVERWLGVYAVVGDQGQLVTVAHQTRRHRRP